MKNATSSRAGIATALVAAAMLLPSVASANSIDTIVTSFTSAAGGWYSTLIGLAQGLFAALATIQLAWAAIKWILEGDDVKALMASLVKQIMVISFFFYVLTTANTWVPAIIDSFTQAGAATGAGTTLTPSSVIDYGIYAAAAIPSKVGAMDLFTQPLVVMIAGLAAILILVGFLVAAAQLAVTQVQAAVILSGGVLLLGFGGSSFTRDFVQKYFSYAISVGVRLLVLYLVLGIALTEAQGWGDYLLSADITDFNVQPFFVVMGNAVLFAFMCWTVPKTAGEMLSGAIDMSAGAVAGGIAGGAVAGAAAATGVAAAGAPIRGALQAATAGVKAEQAAGKSGAEALLGGIGRAASAMGTEAKTSASSYVGLGQKSAYAPTSDTIGGRAASRLEAEGNKAAADKAAGSADAPGAKSSSNSAGSANEGGKAGTGPETLKDEIKGNANRIENAFNNPLADGKDIGDSADKGARFTDPDGSKASVGSSVGNAASGAAATAADTTNAMIDGADGAAKFADSTSASNNDPAGSNSSPPPPTATNAPDDSGSPDSATTANNAPAGAGSPSSIASTPSSNEGPRLPGKYQDRDLSNPIQRPDIPPDTGPSAGITIRLDDPD